MKTHYLQSEITKLKLFSNTLAYIRPRFSFKIKRFDGYLSTNENCSDQQLIIGYIFVIHFVQEFPCTVNECESNFDVKEIQLRFFK